MNQKIVLLRPALSFAILKNINLIILTIMILILSVFINVHEIAFASIVPAILLIYRIMYWRMVKYEISSSQIKYTRGVFQINIDFLEMYRIKDFDQRQSLVMRLLSIMHIHLMTSDITHPVLELKGIPKSNIADVLRKLVLKSRKENRVYEVD